MDNDRQYTRREFFRKRFGGIRDVIDNLAEVSEKAPANPVKTDSPPDVPKTPLLRPPGAIEETAFLAGCTKCMECYYACPYNVIRRASSARGAAEDTPILDYTIESCMMCTDFPCIKACEPGVLTRDAGIKMGTARVIIDQCLAHQGTECTACSDKCPVPDAIELPDNKPNIASTICTGCGICQLVCLAPDNAIMIVPERERPMPAK